MMWGGTLKAFQPVNNLDRVLLEVLPDVVCIAAIFLVMRGLYLYWLTVLCWR